MSDEKLSGSAPEPQPATSVGPEAPAAANEINAPVEPRCKCGADPHRDREGFCANSHPLKGHGGKLSFKHGLYAEQPPIDADVESISSAQVMRQLAVRIRREVARFVGASSNHRMSAREQADALNAMDRLCEIEKRIGEMDAASSVESSGREAPADWPQRLALIFANQPDQFGEFIKLLLTADRDRCGPLRSQVRLTLDHLEPEGVPVWRGKKSDDGDTVLL